MVVVGASNMLQTVPYLSKTNGKVIDLTEKGWLANKTNVQNMAAKLNSVDGRNENTVVVLDLFNNFQLDD